MSNPPSPVSRSNPWRLPGWAGLLLILLAVLFGWFYLRGAWATAHPADPTRPEDGVWSQVALDDDGRNSIRTSVVVPVPVDVAWSILSNYEEWERLFKTVRRKEPTEALDGNRHHVVTEVATPLGTLSLDFIVTHTEMEDGGYLASWDAPTPELPVNKGTMRISPRNGQTLFVYTIRKKYRRYPEFLVNNMLLEHQTDLVRTLRDRMLEAARELKDRSPESAGNE